MSAILADSAIAQAIAEGKITIDPYDPAKMNPTSIDVTLGNKVAVYKHWVNYFESPARDGACFSPKQNPEVFDSKKKPEIQVFDIHEQGWVLKPGIGYLMHTAERVGTRHFSPTIDGKSGVGRLFIQIHATAGFGDPGFKGQFTLEVTTTHPIRVYAGMKIGQVVFATIEGKVEKLYDETGSYTGENSEGPVASKAWKQFQK